MARRKVNKSEPIVTNFSRVYEMEYGNFTIEKGDLIKITGEYGTKFRFLSVTTNITTGATWVDCIETYRGQPGAFRSFALDRVKRIPKKRTRKAKTND